MMTPPDVKPKLPRLSSDGDCDPLGTSDLEVAAQSITLMSPDSFSVRPPGANGKATAAAAAKQPATLPPIKIKDEIVDADSFNATADISKDKEARPARITRSGQSSPSREVQDILCENEAIGGLGTEVIITEEDDYDDDQEDLEDDDDEEDDDEEEDEEVAADFKNLDNSTRLSLEQRALHPPDASTLSNPTEEWTTKKIKAEPLDVPHRAAAGAGAAAPVVVAGAADLGVLLHKMDELSRLVASQRSEIQVLRKEIMEGRRSDRQKVEQLVRQAGQSTNNALIKERKNVGDLVASSIGKTVSGKVESAVASEMKRVAPAIVQSAMTSVGHAIERDLQAKMGRVDAQMKDAVGRCMQSKALTDSIAAAVCAGLHASMQSAFSQTLTNTLIPAFERAIQNMFVQLSTTFTRGMKEHESLIKKSADPILKELQKVANASSKTMHSNDALVSSIRRSVVEEVGHALERHTRSLAATPQVEGSPAANAAAARNSFEENQRMVRAHLSRGDFDQAFQTALNASSLPLVVNTCEMVNPSQIFTPPCQLSQHVILALIQQLGSYQSDIYLEKRVNTVVFTLHRPQPGRSHRDQAPVPRGEHHESRQSEPVHAATHACHPGGNAETASGIHQGALEQQVHEADEDAADGNAVPPHHRLMSGRTMRTAIEFFLKSNNYSLCAFINFSGKKFTYVSLNRMSDLRQFQKNKPIMLAYT